MKKLFYIFIFIVFFVFLGMIFFPENVKRIEDGMYSFKDKSIKDKSIKETDRNEYGPVFSYIYKNNLWGEGSGQGSDPINAAPYIDLLQLYFDDPRFQTIVDLGNGDWQIMSHITIPKNKVYKGYDVVRHIQAENRRNFSSANVQFYDISGLNDFEKQKISGDLLIIKDVIQHWPSLEIKYFIEKILPNFKYALITNNITPDVPENTGPVNSDIPLGGFRPVALTKNPFNLNNVTVLLEYPTPGIKQVLLYVNPSFVKKNE